AAALQCAPRASRHRPAARSGALEGSGTTKAWMLASTLLMSSGCQVSQYGSAAGHTVTPLVSMLVKVIGLSGSGLVRSQSVSAVPVNAKMSPNAVPLQYRVTLALAAG